jgi:hypothetical protein
MWVAHYEFHLLTGALTIVPVAQAPRSTSSVSHHRWTVLAFGGCESWFGVSSPAGVRMLGGLGSLAVAYGISQRDYPERPGLATVPWALLTVVHTDSHLDSVPADGNEAIGFSG